MNFPTFHVFLRRLTSVDAPAYRALRLRALAENPEAFTSSAQEEKAKPLSWSEDRLSANPTQPHDLFIGAFLGASEDDESAGGQLVGMAGLQGRYRLKERHNATVVGMYVVTDGGVRGQGVGRMLMQEVLAQARKLPGLQQLDLTVTEGNASAQHLYEQFGFKVFGVQPRAIRVGDSYHAKVLMTLPLRPEVAWAGSTDSAP